MYTKHITSTYQHYRVPTYHGFFKKNLNYCKREENIVTVKNGKISGRFSICSCDCALCNPIATCKHVLYALQRHNTENLKQILSRIGIARPQSQCLDSCVCDLHINHTIDVPIQLQENMWTDPWNTY
jgi:hypothetical protein